MPLFLKYVTDDNTKVYLWESDGGSVWYESTANSLDRSTANMRIGIAPTTPSDYQIINDTITLPFPSTHSKTINSMTDSNAKQRFRQSYSANSVVSPVDGTSKNVVSIENEITLTKETVTLDNGQTKTIYASQAFPKNGDGCYILILESHSILWDFTPDDIPYKSNLPAKAYYGQLLRDIYITSNDSNKGFDSQQFSVSITYASGSPYYSFGVVTSDNLTLNFNSILAGAATTTQIITLTERDLIVITNYVKYGLLNIPNTSNICMYENIGTGWNKITDTFKIYDDSLSSLKIGIWFLNENQYYINAGTIKLPYALESSEIEPSQASESVFNSLFNTSIVNNTTGDLINNELEFIRTSETVSGTNIYLYEINLPLTEYGHKALKFQTGTMLAVEENCIPSIESILLFAGQKFTISATALEGYEFNNPDNTPVSFPAGQFTYTSAINANKDTSTYIYIIQNTTIVSTLYVYFTAEIKQTPITETYPFIQVYSPTNEEMNKLAEKRFTYFKNGTTEYTDLGNYILDVYRIFIDVPLSEVKTHIKLYTYDTNIDSYVVTEQKIITSCGSLYIYETPYNKLSYEETELYAYLPFYGIEKLNISKYMNKVIYLDYITDILTGDTSIILYYILNDNNVILDNFTTNIGYKIPYETNVDKTIKTLTTNSLMLMDKTPYILKRIPSNCIENTIQSNNMRNTISTFTGYCEFIDIDLHCDCPLNEYTEIINCLKEGVII